MATLSDLVNIIGPPMRIAPGNDWEAVEEELGLRIPSDYKELMDKYATLSFDAFLGLLIPNLGDSPVSEVREEVTEALALIGPENQAMEVIDDDGHVTEYRQFDHYPKTGGLVPWGFTQNGDICLWLAHGEPDMWRVCVSDGVLMWQHTGGLLDFLLRANTGTLKCPVLTNNGNLDRTFRQLK